MNKNFSYYLSKFLKEYLVIERNFSKETIKSYTKNFQMLIEYLVNTENIKLKDITFENITRDIILDYLNYLEEKGNSIRTRNQRLACIKSFYNYCLYYETQNIDNINKVLTINYKKCVKPIQDYLTEEEIASILSKVDKTTKKGRRDLLILSLLYDTAARASEIINLKIEDINLDAKIIKLTGKGNKIRIVPIMEPTKDMLIYYLKENDNKIYLFENNCNQPYNWCFIRDVISKYIKNIDKKVTPHMFRRSRAIHLLDKGINIVYIQELLGHSDVTTTQEYTKAITKTKFEAIEKITPKLVEELPDWNDDQDLLNQLLNM